MAKTADVIIIGSGIIGCATAYYLAKKGRTVIVLDQNDTVGNGGSARNGGGVRQSGRDKRELPLMMFGIKYLWQNLSEELGTDVEYMQKGNLRLGKTEEHLRILSRLAENARSCGLDVSMVSGAEAREICPYLSDEVIGASWCPTDGHANPLTTTLGYYKNARRLGVQFYTGESVTALRKYQGKIRYVVTQNQVFEAQQVLVAAGYESREILKSVGIDIPMSKLLLETLVTEAQPPMFYQMLGTATADFYGHQSKHGSFVFGGSSGLEAVRRDFASDASTNLTASYISRAIIRYFPVLSDVKIVRTWAGWIDECVDGVPVLSDTPEVPGLVIACGFTGHGFGIGPAAGYVLAQLLAEETPSVDLSAFRYDRFRAKF